VREAKPPPVAGAALGTGEADRLDSWKEVALHLRREVRTVQRWERSEGLPVHRHLHHKLASVYAFRSELDEWWNARRADLDHAPKQHRLMLAVLPIENLSRDPEQEYLSDGLTEELFVHFGRLNPERLGVIARLSSMAYKGTKKRAGEVGRELGVDYLVGGSTRRAGDAVRITAHLIEVRDESEVWADSYDRAVDDLLSLQREVAAAIGERIHVALAPHFAPARAEIRGEAYEAYLHGRFWLAKRTAEALAKAIRCFERAAELDPRSALPHAGLADCYDVLAYYGADRPDRIFPKAKAAAMRAVELDPSSPEAHVVLAEVAYLYDWNWTTAEREFRHAAALGPNSVAAHQCYGVFLSLLGRHQEAAEELRVAERLDPLSVLLGTQIALACYEARRYDDAIARIDRVLELDPGFSLAHTVLGMAYIQKSLVDRALEEFDRARTLAPDELTALALCGYALGVAGKRGDARKVLRRLQALAAERHVSSTYPAAVHLGLGDLRTTIDLAEQACRERSGFLTRLRVEPLFDPLRSDPRFAKLVRAVGLG
jgi:TolB-like protein/Tfp pilus assembly protein PilF